MKKTAEIVNLLQALEAPMVRCDFHLLSLLKHNFGKKITEKAQIYIFGKKVTPSFKNRLLNYTLRTIVHGKRDS